MKEKLYENLLNTWVRFNNTIKGNRFLSGTSLNEMVVLQIVLRDEDAVVTPSILCRETKLLKSQLNAVLNSMQKAGLVRRETVLSDKRKQRIVAEEKGKSLYESQHKAVLKTVEGIASGLSDDETDSLMLLMNRISDKADEIAESER